MPFDLFTRYSEEGDQPDLKAWAATTLPHLEHHLEMAKGRSNSPFLELIREVELALSLDLALL